MDFIAASTLSFQPARSDEQSRPLPSLLETSDTSGDELINSKGGSVLVAPPGDVSEGLACKGNAVIVAVGAASSDRSSSRRCSSSDRSSAQCATRVSQSPPRSRSPGQIVANSEELQQLQELQEKFSEISHAQRALQNTCGTAAACREGAEKAVEAAAAVSKLCEEQERRHRAQGVDVHLQSKLKRQAWESTMEAVEEKSRLADESLRAKFVELYAARDREFLARELLQQSRDRTRSTFRSLEVVRERDSSPVSGSLAWQWGRCQTLASTGTGVVQPRGVLSERQASPRSPRRLAMAERLPSPVPRSARQMELTKPHNSVTADTRPGSPRHKEFTKSRTSTPAVARPRISTGTVSTPLRKSRKSLPGSGSAIGARSPRMPDMCHADKENLDSSVSSNVSVLHKLYVNAQKTQMSAGKQRRSSPPLRRQPPTARGGVIQGALHDDSCPHSARSSADASSISLVDDSSTDTDSSFAAPRQRSGDELVTELASLSPEELRKVLELLPKSSLDLAFVQAP